MTTQWNGYEWGGPDDNEIEAFQEKQRQGRIDGLMPGGGGYLPHKETFERTSHLWSDYISGSSDRLHGFSTVHRKHGVGRVVGVIRNGDSDYVCVRFESTGAEHRFGMDIFCDDEWSARYFSHALADIVSYVERCELS